ncbi:MAG: 50S ribosomal protein L30 [Candidatus Tectomicrobia bacterium]|nr:50S ribosomal protein L30 [Candidatus Tectomicrobia bacterium]
MGKSLVVTLVRSPIGRPRKQRAVLKGLGLTKLHKTITYKDTPEIRGMVEKVIHLLEVKEV